MSTENNISTTREREPKRAKESVNMPRTEYANISIPKGIKDEIERLLREFKEAGIDLGYTSAPEFIKEAVRVHLDRKRSLYVRQKAPNDE